MNELYYISSREFINSRFNIMIKDIDKAIEENRGAENTDIIIKRTFWNSLSDKQKAKLNEYKSSGAVLNIDIY